MDNVASKAINNYLGKEYIKLQILEPHNHQSNASERAIQTFKNNFISGLCIGDLKFPTFLWSNIVRQSQDLLNMLRT